MSASTSLLLGMARQLVSAATTYRIDTELDIAATPQQVWDVFGDFASWGGWNDFMELPVVPEKVGRHCQALFHLDKGCMKQSVHDPEVLVLEPGKELRWRDYRGPLVSHFFRGSHWWVLEPLPGGDTRLLHGAEMHGLVVPFLRATMEATTRGYVRFNKALQAEVLARSKRQPGRSAVCVVHEGGGAALPVHPLRPDQEL